MKRWFSNSAEGMDSLSKAAVILGVILVLGYVSGITLVNDSNDRVGQVRSTGDTPDTGPDVSTESPSDGAYEFEMVHRVSSANKFELPDLRGFDALFRLELQKRLGVRVVPKLDRQEGASSLGTISVLVSAWNERQFTGPGQRVSQREKIPTHIELHLRLETTEGTTNWDGPHSLEVDLPIPIKRGDKPFESVRESHIRDMVRYMFVDLPGRGRFRRML